MTAKLCQILSQPSVNEPTLDKKNKLDPRLSLFTDHGVPQATPFSGGTAWPLSCFRTRADNAAHKPPPEHDATSPLAPDLRHHDCCRVRDGDRIVARPMTIDHADKLHGGSATKRTSSRR
jgi:hypothetical protein